MESLGTNIKRKDIPKSNKELNELFTLVVNKIKFINENYDKIESSSHLQELQDAYEEIYGKSDQKGKLEELQEAYSEILEDDEENENYSLKSQIESLLEDIDNDKKKINDFIIRVEGEYGENESGEKVKIKEGYFNRIEGQIKKFDEQYEKIKKELDAGATNVALSKVFNDKVKDYSSREKNWALCFIIVLTSMIFFLIIISITNFFTGKINTLTEIFYHILFNLPLFAFIIWLNIFIGNRRAEAKKLEESYKHKEVMARAYIGYKESISELTNDDNELLEKHMENLLDAMSVDSSKFLSSKGENHPLYDLFKNFLTKDIKDIFPEGELDFPGGKVTFKK